eukprot:6612734-Pyramimonas_sp.AAC.1
MLSGDAEVIAGRLGGQGCVAERGPAAHYIRKSVQLDQEHSRVAPRREDGWLHAGDFSADCLSRLVRASL